MDAMERLIEADPLPEAERLSEADQREADALLARILAEPQARTRRSRRWVPAVAATAAAVALALVAIDVLDEDAPGPSVVERAVAAVSDPNAIYHTVEVMRIGGVDSDHPRRISRAYMESWYGPNHTTHRKGYDLRHGRKGRLRSEQVSRLRPKRNGRFGGTGAMYDPVRNTITHVRVGRISSTRVPFLDPNGDPGAGMRRLEREGRLRMDGRARLDGREVYRLTSGPFRFAQSRNRIDYLVDARTYYPVLMRWVVSGKHRRGLFEIRYLTYERLPATAENRRLLKLDPHPGAKVIPLPKP